MAAVMQPCCLRSMRHSCVGRPGSVIPGGPKLLTGPCQQARHARVAWAPCGAPCTAGPVTCARRGRASRTVAVRATLDPAVLSSSAPLLRDAAFCAAAGIAARIWTKLFDYLVTKGVLEQKLSRKLVHITSGPLLMLTWPLFSANPWARFWAALVPGIQFARLLLAGLGLWSDPGLVASVSRSGDRGELLQGPLYYCVILIATTLLCWRDDPTGMIAVCLMCGGDGLADVVGRRWGASNRLPYNPSKSLAGSLAMMVGGAAMAAGFIALFCSLGFFECYAPGQLLPALLAVAGVATLVESLPINQTLDDNLSVPAVAAVAAVLLIPHATTCAAAIPVPL